MRGKSRRIRFACALLVLLIGGAGLGSEAAVTPDNTVSCDNILVLANSAYPGSVGLAKYYCDKRRIPSANLLILDLPGGKAEGKIEAS